MADGKLSNQGSVLHLINHGEYDHYKPGLENLTHAREGFCYLSVVVLVREEVKRRDGVESEAGPQGLEFALGL